MVASSADAGLWNAVAAQYDSCVLDNFTIDLNGILTTRLSEVCDSMKAVDGTKGLSAVDFGCGAGKWLPALADRCETVLGIDFSVELLRAAQSSCLAAGLQQDQVRLLLRDLGEPWPTVVLSSPRCDTALQRVVSGACPRADVAVCANVVMSPNPRTRGVMLQNLSQSLRLGLALILKLVLL